MDIYNFIRSRDVSDYCREINKTWNTCEMAIIISRSNRTMQERHEAWHELIDDYPDMPAIPNWHNEYFDSIHKKLTEIIDYDHRVVERFKMPESGAVYKYKVWCDSEYYHSDSIFSSLEKAMCDVKDNYDKDKVREIVFEKLFIDDTRDSKYIIEVCFDSNCTIINWQSVSGSVETHTKWFPGADRESANDYILCDLFYIDIPTPFKCGDILTIPETKTQFKQPYIFVLNSLIRDNQKWLKTTKSGENGDGSDLSGWGYFVDDGGGLFGDHVLDHDRFEYYRGTLEENQRLLHYVNLFIKNDIDLPALLTVHSRIMAEHQLNNDFCIDTHGVYISEEFLAENRLSSDEKEHKPMPDNTTMI